jgi:hypothetical protein
LGGGCQTGAAIALVLAAVPEGWAAALSEIQLKPEEIAALKMQPGDIRELTDRA